jgi:hypothetical protein
VYFERENEVASSLQPFELRAPCKARWVWAGAAAIFIFALYPLQFAKAGSAATQPQQEKNNSADVQRGRGNITGFDCTVASRLLRRCAFGEFESLAVASRRARHR